MIHKKIQTDSKMVPEDQYNRLVNEIHLMSLDGLKTLQTLSDTLLQKTLQECLKINRYRCRRSVTRNIEVPKLRTIIQEAILDKVYDEIWATIAP